MAVSFFPGSFYDNLDAAVRTLGLKQPGVLWALASVSWDSIEDRNKFFDQLAQRNYFDVVNEGGE